MGNPRRRRVIAAFAIAASLGLAAAPSVAQPGPAPVVDVVERNYLEAQRLSIAGDDDQAAAILEGLAADHLDHALAAQSVELLLDVLLRTQRFERFAEWIERLNGEQAFLARNPGLAQRLAHLARQVERRNAEALERDGDYAGCAAAYLAIYQADPTAMNADEVVYNAGVCYEAAGAISAAVTMYRTLGERFPRSPLVRRALAREASRLDSIAHYDQAAERYETYVNRYGGEADARMSLARAIELRAALGQGRRALALTRRYHVLFKRRSRADAARLWLAATDFHPATDARARIAHLREYLREHARAGSLTDRVVAHAELGRLLWQQSCTTPDATGLCIARRPGAAKSCKPTVAFQLAKRDGALVTDARREFSQAVKLVDTARNSSEVEPRARRAHAMAIFFLAEPDAEALITTRAPSMGDYDPTDRTRIQQFATWLRTTQTDLAKFAPGDGAAYGRTLFAPQAGEWRAAAMLRAAQVIGGMDKAISAIEIPTKLASGPHGAEVVTAFCDELARQVEPIQKRTTAILEACIAGPAQNQWSAECARTLEVLDPARYPRLRERVGKPAAGWPLDRASFREPVADAE